MATAKKQCFLRWLYWTESYLGLLGEMSDYFLISLPIQVQVTLIPV